jgi:hypothetical protein
MKGEIFYSGVENEALIGKLGEVVENLLSESKSRIKLYYDTRKKLILVWQEHKS